MKKTFVAFLLMCLSGYSFSSPTWLTVSAPGAEVAIQIDSDSIRVQNNGVSFWIKQIPDHPLPSDSGRPIAYALRHWNVQCREEVAESDDVVDFDASGGFLFEDHTKNPITLIPGSIAQSIADGVCQAKGFVPAHR